MSQRRQPTLACPRKPQCDGRPVDRTIRRVAAERLVFRPMGGTGEPYPPWVRDLKGKSGAYVIRAVGLFSSTIVYVGESHAGRLYDTVCRHFQGWRREKTRWLGFFVPSDNDPGTTYDREVCEVAVRVTAIGCAGARRRRSAVLRSRGGAAWALVGLLSARLSWWVVAAGVAANGLLACCSRRATFACDGEPTSEEGEVERPAVHWIGCG